MQIIVQNRPADPLHLNECDCLTSINDIRNGMTVRSDIRALMNSMKVAVLVVRLCHFFRRFIISDSFSDTQLHPEHG